MTIAEKLDALAKPQAAVAAASKRGLKMGRLEPRRETMFGDLTRRWASPSITEAAEISNGLSIKVLKGLNDVLPETIYRIVPKSTLANQKRKSDNLSPEQSDRLYQAGKVFGLAMSVYGDEALARQFLTREHPMLDDRTPLEVALESSVGADIVVNLLGRGAYGGGA